MVTSYGTSSTNNSLPYPAKELAPRDELHLLGPPLLHYTGRVTALCNDIEPGILGAWPLRRCSKQAFMHRRCDVDQWHCKLL
jgi:hypothetical protein